MSKHYRGAQNYAALREDLIGVVGRIAGRRRVRPATVTALDDVSFEIHEGESVGLVGLNGAGKTTALKLISRITYPTSGLVRVRGRVGALLEVGTGLHPELTGRENVHLYGRILGLEREAIRSRFDEIVEFAGIGSAIDQPVKQYSSGMRLRLGFSVAAHVEPDLLLVDEAIAVGDAGFQYKCIERMAALVRQGRTLVLVSHDMSAIETLCDRAILLRGGHPASDGPAPDVVREYLISAQRQRVSTQTLPSPSGEGLQITAVSLHDRTGAEVDVVTSDEEMTVRLHYKASQPLRRPIFTIGLSEGSRTCFTVASMLVDGCVPEVIDGEGYVDCTFARLPLQPMAYAIWGEVIGEAGYGEIVDWQQLRRFRVAADIDGLGKSAVTHSMVHGPVKMPYHWTVGPK
ncbi:MAG: lipopolysaccharide transport system ATP-binding protein [Solirubrobacteraceae bacterium]|nr:lipopolysaccharide transport system ATP-binding protein [Solirubrobacteraceae bacterium]